MKRSAQRTLLRWALALSIGAAILQPAPLFACAVCFGQTDADIAKGLVWGVVALLMIVASVLAGITAFFVQAARRSSALEAASSSTKLQSDPVTTSDQSKA